MTKPNFPSEGQLLQEARALVRRALGESPRFGSRSDFFNWFTRGGGQKQLVSAGAMELLKVVTPDTALEYAVALLRMSVTRRPHEAYARAGDEPLTAEEGLLERILL